MLKKTIKYTDFNGEEVVDDFYFNLSKSELIKMEAGVAGGLSSLIQRVVNTRDVQGLLGEFEKLIRSAYGVRSDDGKRFIKGPSVWEEFTQSPAYDELYVELFDPDKLNAFIEGIMPTGLVEQLRDVQPKLDAQPAVTIGTPLPPPPTQNG